MQETVIVIGDGPYSGVPLAAKRIADSLAKSRQILYVDPPVSHAGARRRPELSADFRRPRLRQLGPNLHRLVPVVLPMKNSALTHPLTTRLIGYHIQRALSTLKCTVSATIAFSPNYNVFGYAGERVKVFVAGDDFTAGAELMSWDRRRIMQKESQIVAAADVVFAASQVLQEKWQALGVQAHFLPNGVNAETFIETDSAPIPDDGLFPGHVAILMGHLTPRVDLSLVEAVASRDIHVLLIGPTRFIDSTLSDLTRNPHVHWLGAKPFQQLFGYLRVAEVGLVPYTDSEFNRASFPLKTLEYLAAGLPVVTTDLPATRWLGSPDIKVAPSPEEFAEAVVSSLPDSRDPQLVSRRRAFAARHSWDHRAKQLAETIGLN